MSLDPETQLRLDAAIALRESGRDDEARLALMELHAADPDDPQINYQCAWVHDKLGLESDAVPFYETAIARGLAGTDLKGAMLGLGSTYRTLGRYDQARSTLQEAVRRFPGERGVQVFLAMALYNTGDAKGACQVLLGLLAETSSDPSIRRYREAIEVYARDLDRIWA